MKLRSSTPYVHGGHGAVGTSALPVPAHMDERVPAP